MLQPYLCIGGVEVAHPVRTLSYMKNLGHPYMRAVPDTSCLDCFGDEREVSVCEVPYAVKAGFDASVNGELAAQVWEVFRGAEPVTQVGVRRETNTVSGTPLSRPPVPTSGWVASDYVDPFSMPLL